MRLVEKSSHVSELVPQGYKSWAEYYRKESVRDALLPYICLFILLAAYVAVGILEGV